MTHLGVYYTATHRIPEDTDYIRKLQPSVIRLLDCDVQQIADMHALVPGAVICPRTWAIDDNGGAAVRALMADPVATAIDHANQYAGQLAQWKQQAQQRGLTLPPDDHIYFNAANEPNQGGTPDKICAYNVAFLNRCTELGLRATALCLGVGWPDNSGPDTPVNWQPYAAIVEPLQRGHHWLEVHEYFDKTGPQDGWTWWAGRHLQCPFDVPILLGEIGIDCYVRPGWDKNSGNRGWQGNVTPDQYGDMIQWHISHSDTRVVAALVFITDIANKEWASFNTRPAHGAFLARKDAMVPQATPKTQATIHLPNVSTGVGEPPQSPTGDNFSRILSWLWRWEGGYQNDPQDIGNWTGCAVGKGENKGTNFGISACSYPDLDIAHLTQEAAAKIYQRDYWQASGADKLAWPLCLLVMDTAVLHGVGTAQKWLSEVGLNPYAFAAKRLHVYTGLDNWHYYGAGWTNRTADLLAEMGKA